MAVEVNYNLHNQLCIPYPLHFIYVATEINSYFQTLLLLVVCDTFNDVSLYCAESKLRLLFAFHRICQAHDHECFYIVSAHNTAFFYQCHSI